MAFEKFAEEFGSIQSDYWERGDCSVPEKDKLRFVFWNIRKNEANISRLVDYASSNDVDIIVMCECSDIEGHSFRDYAIAQHIDRPNGIEVLYRNSIVYYARERSRFSIVKVAGGYDYSIAVAHLNSNVRSSGEDYRDADIEQMKEDLLIEEKKSGNKNTCILGDLNTDLFDSQMNKWTGFNARLFSFQMKSGKIKRHENEQDLFYNPMLKLYKDSFSGDTASGTYYYASDNYGWHCYDHILMKKPLVERFDIDSLKLVNALQGEGLVKESIPDVIFSDHLPFCFDFMK